MNRHIDLSQFSEDELNALNRRIVERLMSLQQHRRYEALARFDLGDTVSFMAEAGRVVVGKVARANTKTITVISTSGQRWRVSPTLLSHLTEGALADEMSEAQPSRRAPLALVSATADRSPRR